MSIEINHALVHAKDSWAAAREVGRVLGRAEPSSYGPFAVLPLTTAPPSTSSRTPARSRPAFTPSWSARTTSTPLGPA
jgi:hypothetical protein